MPIDGTLISVSSKQFNWLVLEGTMTFSYRKNYPRDDEEGEVVNVVNGEGLGEVEARIAKIVRTYDPGVTVITLSYPA